jgi:hypothetical protein
MNSNETRSKPRHKNERQIESVVDEIFVFIKQAFPFPRFIKSATAGLKEGKKLSGEAPSLGFRPRFEKEILQKISLTRQTNSPQARVAASSSTNAVSFSSARTLEASHACVE